MTALWQLLRRASESATRGDASQPAARAERCVDPRAHSFAASALFASGAPRPQRAISTTAVRRALEQIRRAFLQDVAELEPPPSADALIFVLRAFDRVYDALETEEGATFGSRHDEPDAPSLVVELAHDMRSPLTSILFLVDALRQQFKCTTSHGSAPHQLNIVYNAAFQLSALVSDVVDLTQEGAPLLEPESIPLSVAGLIRSVLEMVQPLAEQKQLAIRTVWTGADTRIGHPLALRRVLLNLTTNALKFATAGEVTISAAEVSHSRMRFEVCDTGPGVPADVINSLFTSGLARTKYAHRAVGLSRTRLGLAICDALIRKMGSELHVRSILGEGTSFWFELEMPSPTVTSKHIV